MTESRALTKNEPAEMQMNDQTGEESSLLNRDREEFTLKIQAMDEAGGWIYGPGCQRESIKPA